ncbi:MAG: sirohydrochlorin chelatase [Halanaerobiales bacterium]
MEKAVIILTHGSRNDKSNKQFKKLITKIKSDLSSETKGAFLEFAEPQFEDVVEKLLKKDIKDITILPLFFFAGYHVQEDIPNRIVGLKEKYPDLFFTLLEPVGLNEKFSQFVKENLNSV